mmetsp:Transcript_5714/g.8706  ORF Transcript_5714/g.8706 Transcript_5714/m.8706 type:complete len:673 (-) Transcript_5714:201-2219(-)
MSQTTKDDKDETSSKKGGKNDVKKRLLAEMSNQVVPITIGSVAMLASTLSNQALPRLLGKLLDQKSASGPAIITSSPSSTGANAKSLSSSLLLVVIGGGAASFLRTAMLNMAKDGIACRLRSDLFRSLLVHRDWEWYHSSSHDNVDNDDDDEEEEEHNDETNEKDSKKKKKKKETKSKNNSPGALITILTTDITKISESLTTSVANLLRSSCSVMFATTHMAKLNTPLLGLSASIVPVVGFSAVVLQKFIKKYIRQADEIEARISSFAEERLINVSTVKACSRAEDESFKYDTLQQQHTSLGRKVSLARGAFMGFTFMSSSASLLCVVNAGGKAVAKGQMTNGELTSFATYSFLLGLGTGGIFRALGELMQGKASAERVYGLMGDEEKNKEKENKTNGKATAKIQNPSDVKSLCLKNVSFSYRAHPERTVLSDISLSLERGKVVALVGKNGAGKSTMANLLSALLSPTSGNVTVEPQNVNYHADLDRDAQTSLVQIVPQHPALFDDSIMANVTYGLPLSSDVAATESRVWDALRASNADTFVQNLEGKLEFNVGRDGCKLSGGQRQRIALARALLCDPCLLILDEPTSSMDVEGETAVADAVAACRHSGGDGTVDDAKNSRALLLVTHRASTLRLADVVVVLEGGKIVETGLYDKLCADGESKLCKLMPDLL